MLVCGMLGVNSRIFHGKDSKQDASFKTHNFKNYATTNTLGADVVSFGNVAALSTKKLHGFISLISNIKLRFKGYEIPVHNPKIAPHMREAYSSKTFKRLFAHADNNGVFNFTIDKHGFVKTTEIASAEDPKMADYIWVTDTCRNISLLKRKRPELCIPSIEALSTFYKGQQPAMEAIINDPASYNRTWNVGLGHVFNPDTNEPAPEFLRTRLESVGLYLQRSSELILEGLNKEKDYGYKSADAVGENTIESIAACIKYLKAIDYPKARSCGAWEEKPLPPNTSLTSDVGIINEAFRRVLKLMYAKTYNPQILQVRAKILNSKHGDVFKNETALTDLLTRGKKRLADYHFDELPGHDGRKLDATMVFISKYDDTRLIASGSVLDDIKEHLKLLELLEGNSKTPGLVRENGMIRYVGDEYRSLDVDRANNLRRNTVYGNDALGREAQWFMVSDMSTSYGVQLRRLIKLLKKENRQPTQEEKGLLGKLLEKETEYINRGYARITGEKMLKANDQLCPKYGLPEAYQAVTHHSGNINYLPGTNTSLAWAKSSLLDASTKLLVNLRMLEKEGYLVDGSLFEELQQAA